MNKNLKWRGSGINRPNKLTKLAIVYITAKKICRKCSKRLPLDAIKCTNPKCHNTDLRLKKTYNVYNYEFQIENNYYNKVKKLK